jgi:predicted permease
VVWFSQARHFVYRIWRRREVEQALDEEVRAYFEVLVDRGMEQGLSREAAVRAARMKFEGPEQVKERVREARIGAALETFFQDLRYAARGFRRNPGFTLAAVVSLALGIGANSAIFSALDAALWKPLPVSDPNTLVNIAISRNRGGDETDLPAAFARQLHDSGIFAGVIITSADGLSFSYDGPAERIIGQVVSPDYFTTLGVRPMLGQSFSSEEHRGGWSAEAVLSYDFWKRRFGADPTVIGRTIHLNTYPFTVVGIAPPSFFGLVRGSDYELRIPFLPAGRELSQIAQINGLPGRWLGTHARLRPGQSIAEAQAAADAQLQTFLQTTSIEEFRQAGLRHLRLSPGWGGDYERTLQFRTPLYVLLVLVAIVLLIACANVASMLIARASARTRELSIRVSLGAGRSRLIRQLLTESILLSLIGGGLGIVIAYWTAAFIVHFVPDGHVNIVLDLHLDVRVLLFTVAVSFLTGLLVGLTAALQATRGNLSTVLKADTAASAGGRHSAGLRKMLVVSQVAFSILLMTAAGTFIRTLLDLRPEDYRANPKQVLLFTIKPQQEIYSDERKRTIAAELVRRVSQIPGVHAAAFAEYGPLGSRTSQTVVLRPGHDLVRVDADAVTPEFFETVGLPRFAGRDFTASDKLGAPRVIIVNQALARVLFPKENPIGRTLRVPRGNQGGDYEIVGLVSDVRYYDLHKLPEPAVWFAMEQQVPYMPTLHVRVETPEIASVTAAIRREFDMLDPGVPVFNIKTMYDRIQDSLAGERMVATLAGGFGLLAVALATVGLYGILAYAVSRRTREIGIRMALGSSSGSVLWIIAREALLLVGAGSISGAIVATAASHIWSRYLPGAHAATAPILTAGALIMLVFSAAAVVIPSARACRIDPLSALRND